MSDVRLWCVVEPAREIKTTRIMASLAPGWGEKSALVKGMPPDDMEAFAIWGQLWTALEAIPAAVKVGRPFWHIDNGFYKSAGGREIGYYRFAYRGMTPVMMERPDYDRLDSIAPDAIKPWRKSGTHVLIALPSLYFGRAVGVNVLPWVCRIQGLVRQNTGRPVRIRNKKDSRPLAEDLRDCHALVTHSSNAAVEAARLGIPVFVAPTSAAAPVGNLDLSKLDNPDMPDTRRAWFASLLCQQYTLGEMRDGTAYRYMRQVREQVDGI